MENQDLVRITTLQNNGDRRGASFAAPQNCFDFLGAVKDIHLATIVPGAVRGNHFHTKELEILLVYYNDEWSFYWDSGKDTQIQRKSFSGSGAVMIEVNPHASLAICNDGEKDIFLVGLRNAPYDPKNPDVCERHLI